MEFQTESSFQTQSNATLYSLDSLKDQILKLQGELTSKEANLQSQFEQLEADRKAFQTERDAWDAKAQSLLAAHVIDQTIVELNVGGQLFTTTKETLCRVPGLLERMFSGKYSFPYTKDNQGRFFFDRDPVYFRYVLNFLRGPSTKLSFPAEDERFILDEFEYFCISLPSRFAVTEDFNPLLSLPAVIQTKLFKGFLFLCTSTSILVVELQTFECIFTFEPFEDQSYYICGFDVSSNFFVATFESVTRATAAFWPFEITFHPFAFSPVEGLDFTTLNNVAISNPKIYGRRLIYGEGPCIRVFDLNTKMLDGEGMRMKTNVQSIDIYEDKGWIVGSAVGGIINLWSLATSKCLQEMTSIWSAIYSLQFSGENELLVSKRDGSIEVWSCLEPKLIHTFEDHEEPAAFARNEDLLITSSDNRTIRIRDTKKGQCLQLLEGVAATHIVFIEKNKFLTLEYDGTVRVWKVGMRFAEEMTTLDQLS